MAITTAEELLNAQDTGRCELIRGVLHMMIPPGFEHGRIANELAFRINTLVRSHGLGIVVAAETGFLLARDPDTVRAPDVGFLAAERAEGPKRGYCPGAPDLAVEVLSPDDRPGYVRDKVAEWLEAGTRAVWIVDPRKRIVAVHEPPQPPVVLDESGVLLGGGVLPGFEVAVREIFA